MTDFVLSLAKERISIKLQNKVLWVTATLLCMLCIICALSLGWGSFDMAPMDVIKVLLHPDEQTESVVIWQLRIPRFLAACFVGALFAMSGAILQNVTRNPIADPSLVGVSQGASLAVVSLIIVWPDVPVGLRPPAAFAGGIIASLLVQTLAMGKQSSESMRFILIGIGVAAMISAVTSAMLTYGNINQAMSALGWLAGSVHTVTWSTCFNLAVCFAMSLPAIFWSIRPMSALQFGPEISIAFGLRLRRDRFLVITLAVALAAFAVSAAGPMGFIGLLAPQLAQRLTPAGTGGRLVLSALTGAVLVASADLIGRTLAAPLQFPAGLVSAVLGVPLFVYLIIQRAKTSQL